MGVSVIILGESGTGKSCSLRNFRHDEIAVINVASKPLPFKSDIKTYNTDDYGKIIAALKTTKRKTIVIDDAQYLMANESMSRAKEKGYEKWTEMAMHFFTLLKVIREQLPDDVIVYLMAHTETDQYGKEKFKTAGRLMDSYSIEGTATICLKTVVDNGYWFATQNNGFDTVKSPLNMFKEAKIENDLKMVDKTIREYYNNFKNESEDNE